MKNYNIYRFGSRVYGTHTPESDHDFIVVSDTEKDYEIHKDKFSINYWSHESFDKRLSNYDIDALECYYLPEKFILKYLLPLNQSHLELHELGSKPMNLPKLRDSISEKASHSWVKAIKKFQVENDLKAARKSLFHSFRIIEFGTQIARERKIVDYSASNSLWFNHIKDLTTETWTGKIHMFKEWHNLAMTRFRVFAPKTPGKNGE